MQQQRISEVKQSNSSANSATDVHNVFAELSLILKNLEEKYTNLEQQFKTATDENFLLKLQNTALLIVNEKNANIENVLKETSKKLEEQTANCKRLLEENTKNAALNDEINKLKLKNSQLSVENEELKSSLLKMKQDEADKTAVMIEQQVRIMEQKLKHVTKELEKEIEECSKLSAENQKLKTLNEAKESESQSQHMTDNTQIEKLEEKLNRLSLELEREVAKNSALAEYNKQLDGLIRGFKSKPLAEKLSADSSESLSNSQEQLNERNNNNCKVLIRELPTEQILEPLENTVIVLASKMSVCLSREDMAKVSIMERKGLKEFSKTISLLVEFKTSDMKLKFISSRRKLKLNSSTKFIQIKEFVDNEIYSLFLYANKKLRANGFSRIWYRDDQVLAKKLDTDNEIIEIKSENHVDEIIKSIKDDLKQ